LGSCRGDRFQTFVDDGLSRTVAVVVPSPATSEVFEATSLTICGAHVFEFVLQFDFFSNRYTVFGDGWSAEAFIQHGVTAFRAQGDFNCVSQMLTPCAISARASPPNFTSFAAISIPKMID